SSAPSTGTPRRGRSSTAHGSTGTGRSSRGSGSPTRGGRRRPAERPSRRGDAFARVEEADQDGSHAAGRLDHAPAAAEGRTPLVVRPRVDVLGRVVGGHAVFSRA